MFSKAWVPWMGLEFGMTFGRTQDDRFELTIKVDLMVYIVWDCMG